MTKTQLENILRERVMKVVSEFMTEHFETEALAVSSNEFCCPMVDDENNEKFVMIKVSIPRGARNGNGGYTDYDGYAARDEYKAELKEKEAKKAEAEEKKKMTEKEKERKRKIKQTKKDDVSEG